MAQLQQVQQIQPQQVQQAIPAGFRSNTSLYVGNLATDVSENDLHMVFEKAFEVDGQPQTSHVLSIKICRDAITRRSLGYGYVNFFDPHDAELALDTLNYYSIKGRPCHIMWSQRDPSLRKSGVGNVIIFGLDKSTDSKKLHDVFSEFGNILSCRVMTDEKGNSKGYGFVHFDSPESALKAVNFSKSRKEKEGKKDFIVLPHVPRKDQLLRQDEKKKNYVNVYVKNLPETLTDDGFKAKFAEFGEITSAKIMRDQNDKSRGFGFVNFSKHEEAQKAVEALHQKDFDGKTLYVARAQKKKERDEEKKRTREQRKRDNALRTPQNVNLYIKNIDESCSDADLKKHFEKFGTITSCKVMLDEKKNSRGFGFVCFSSPEESNKALQEMNGKMIFSKPLYVAIAQSREVRRQQLEQQYYQRQLSRNMQQQQYMYPYPFPAYGYRPRTFNPNPSNYPPNYRNFQPQQAIPRGTTRQQQPPTGGPQRPQRAIRNPVPMNPNSRQNPPFPPVKGSGATGMPVPSNYKFSNTARNTANIQSSPAVQIQVPQTQSTDLANLASQPQEYQKQFIGDNLFYKISQIDQQHAPKITGMLLEMDIPELLHLLESEESLKEKVDEALTLLKGSQ